jgi:hypothetical protein
LIGGLGGEKRLKQVSHMFLGIATAGVSDGHYRTVSLLPSRECYGSSL